MKKRWLALALAVSLLMATALSASADDELPGIFKLEEALRLYNSQLLQSFKLIFPNEAATKVAQYRSSSASMTGDTLWISNADGQVELSGYFREREPSTSEPADSLGLSIARNVDRIDYVALKNVFANMIAQSDRTANLQAIMDWMGKATKGSEVLTMKGYTLIHVHNDLGDIFSLVVDSGKADAPEPKPEPTPVPTQSPEIDPAAKSEPAGTDGPTGESLVSWKGFEVYPLRTERWLFADGKPSLRLYVRVINLTGSKLTMRVENMTVDGTPLPATNLYDIKSGTDSGEASELNILVYPDKDVTDEVVQSVVYGGDLSMRLVLQDAKTYEDVYMEKVRLDLNELPCERTVYEPDLSAAPTQKPKSTKAPKPTRTPKPTQKAYYTPLFEGDKGEDVRRMQRRLIDLGYLNDAADGQFGARTAAAVREFCETNGLGSYSYASSEMLERLYGGSAKAYQEPWVPLIFQDKARGEWRKAKNDQLSFRVKVTNSSRSRTVRAFELYMYATDVWGDKIYGDSIYYGTTTKAVKPGQSVFSDYFLIPDRSRIGTVWCGIKKVIFSDGTIRENDTVDYSSWTIK